jgi:hypothetical protein
VCQKQVRLAARKRQEIKEGKKIDKLELDPKVRFTIDECPACARPKGKDCLICDKRGEPREAGEMEDDEVSEDTGLNGMLPLFIWAASLLNQTLKESRSSEPRRPSLVPLY